MTKFLNHKFKTLPIDCVFEILSYDKRFAIRNGVLMYRIPKIDPRYKMLDNELFPHYNNINRKSYTRSSVYNNQEKTYVNCLSNHYNCNNIDEYYYTYEISNDLYLIVWFLINNIDTNLLSIIERLGTYEEIKREKETMFPVLWDSLIAFYNLQEYNHNHENYSIEENVVCIMANVLYFQQDNGISTIIQRLTYNN
jgi:hypothetical protein